MTLNGLTPTQVEELDRLAFLHRQLSGSGKGLFDAEYEEYQELVKRASKYLPIKDPEDI